MGKKGESVYQNSSLYDKKPTITPFYQIIFGKIPSSRCMYYGPVQRTQPRENVKEGCTLNDDT